MVLFLPTLVKMFSSKGLTVCSKVRVGVRARLGLGLGSGLGLGPLED